MTPHAKKSTWLTVGLIALISTGFSLAYTAGIKTSASTHKIEAVNDRVDHVEVGLSVQKDRFGDFCVEQKSENRVFRAKQDAFSDKQIETITNQSVMKEDIKEIKGDVKKLVADRP